MADGWILEVLADMRAFARQNELPQLAAHLDEATLIATVELANRKKTREQETA